MSDDTLTLFRLRFHGRHGVLPEETARGQEFEVTVKLDLPLAAAGRADDLAQTVDYRAVFETVRSVMEGPPRKLVEALAEDLAARVLGGFSRVRAVEVEVVKLRPPGKLEGAGLAVRLRRTRAAG